MIKINEVDIYIVYTRVDCIIQEDTWGVDRLFLSKEYAEDYAEAINSDTSIYEAKVEKHYAYD